MKTASRPKRDQFDTAIDALANPVRRSIIERLIEAGPSPVSEIAGRLPVSRPCVSQHLKTLKLAGLVDEERSGRQVHYRARRSALAGLSTYLSRLADTQDHTAEIAATYPEDAIDVAMENWAASGLTHNPAVVATIVRLLQLAGALERRYAATAAAHHLTRGDVTLLGTVRRSGRPEGLTPSEIAAAVLYSRPDITRRLVRLEATGMIERRPDTVDQRSHRVRLTPLGQDKVDAIAQEQFGRSYRVFFELPEDRRQAFDQLLRQLLVAMEPERSA